MKNIATLRDYLATDQYATTLARLYCCSEQTTDTHANRFLAVLDGLEKNFGTQSAAALFSAPGRTEIGGNHTDHQHGRVLAGSVNIDMIAAVAANDCATLRVQSEGYDLCEIKLADLDAKKEEENTSAAILRGTCAAFAARGAVLSGLDVYISSNVPKGSGVSSSAAFETLIGTILNELFLGKEGTPAKVSALEIAKVGQWAENFYFGKPCGLMDQTASSVGNIITIDFAEKEHPVVTSVAVDFTKAGLALCIVDSGADHADLTDEYAAVPTECAAVAAVCGAQVLRDVPMETFLSKLPECRAACGDRAVLRAFHFYADDARVPAQVNALQNGDFDTFLRLVNESGESSWQLLQNVTPAGYKTEQSVAIAITVAKQILAGEGAVRVHGGGFAGTIQAFVPLALLDDFKAKTEAVLGEGKCHVLAIRPEGGYKL